MTAYLADHYLREQRGQGARYRRDALQKYRNYVSAEHDFPLAEFRAKHGESSEAVGYNKTMMFFHMLRRRLGDGAFFAGLREFYADKRFTRAGFADIRAAMERVSGASLAAVFDQWINRPGAPALSLARVRVVDAAAGRSVVGELRQTQPGAPFALHVPVRVSLDEGRVVNKIVTMETARQAFEIAVPARPRTLSVDPDFDVFRQLDPDEVPPTLSEVFGAGELVFIEDEDMDPETAQRYRRFMEAVDYAGETRSQMDDAPLPEKTAVWILGWDNARRGLVEQALSRQDLAVSQAYLELVGQRFQAPAVSVTLAARSRDGRPVLWTHLQAGEDTAALARRLRHYGRYSYLVFAQGKPVLRDQWSVVDSPLSITLQP